MVFKLLEESMILQGTLKFRQKVWRLLFCVAFALLFSVSLVFPVEAAELFFDKTNKTVGVDQTFELIFSLNTDGETINAVDGTILFPTDLLELSGINDGNSIVNLWIERPLIGGVGKITFSGVTPGGYRGNKGQLFKLIFKTVKAGEGAISIPEAKVLLNDGKGTETKVTMLQSAVRVSDKPSSQTSYSIIDVDPPEAFTPAFGRDVSVENNKWFVVFATQDKGMGIDHYEIRETRRETERGTDADWVRAESPYFLNDQALRSFIYVKAIDKSGNQRLAILPPASLFVKYEKYLIWGILSVGFSLLLVGGLWFKRRKKIL